MKNIFSNIIYYGLGWCFILLGINNFCIGYTGENIIERISTIFSIEEVNVRFNEDDVPNASVPSVDEHIHQWREGYEYMWIPSSDGRGHIEIQCIYECECGVKKEAESE